MSTQEEQSCSVLLIEFRYTRPLLILEFDLEHGTLLNTTKEGIVKPNGFYLIYSSNMVSEEEERISRQQNSQEIC
jgi:hypothetical protein